MLYTASLSVAEKLGGKMRRYRVMTGYGNDEVAPDEFDLGLYKTKEITWQGLMLNYELKLRNPEAEEWMRRVSAEAAHEDVVLVDSEEDAKRSLRVLLAEMMASMFSGEMKFHYMGEMKQSI